MARPPPIFAASGAISGVTAIIPAAAGSVARPAWNAFMPERRRVLEVQAEQVHQRVDRAGDDQDGQRGADQDRGCAAAAGRPAAPRRAARPRRTGSETIATAKQPSVAADVQPQSLPLLSASTTGASTSAIRSDAGEVDRARAVRIARLLHGARCVNGTQASRDRGVDPEQALPAGGVHQQRRRRSGPSAAAAGRRRPPQRDRLQLPLAARTPPTAGSSRRPGSSRPPRPGSSARRSRRPRRWTARSARTRR